LAALIEDGVDGGEALPLTVIGVVFVRQVGDGAGAAQ
jgi:hypothetical protein